MDAVLRVINNNKIKDIDLSVSEARIVFGAFSAYKTDGIWRFSSDTEVMHNGRPSTSGELRTGDMITIDFSQRLAAMVLEKVTGSPRSKSFRSKFTIGRAKTNDIVLLDSTVSSRHCELVPYNGNWYIHDLGSTNGTVVNDRIVKKQQLQTGDMIKLGSYNIHFGDNICVLNASERVIFNNNAAPQASEDCDPTATPNVTYPYYSRSPRMVKEPGIIQVDIESAPSIGDKPSMGMGGIPLSPSMIAVSLGMQVFRYGMSKKKYKGLQQKRAEIYANYLAQQEQKIINQQELQRSYLNTINPSVLECLKRADVKCPSLWERHPDDKDFLSLRLGTGALPTAASITVPTRHLQMETDELDNVPQQIADKYRMCSDVPISCNIKYNGSCGIVGRREQAVESALRMAVQLSALHSYDEVKIVALFPENERSKWSWLRWLPHCMSDDRSVRFLAGNYAESRSVLEYMKMVYDRRKENSEKWSFGKENRNLPHYIVIVGDPNLLYNSALGEALIANRSELGISGIFLGNSVSDFPYSVRSIVNMATDRAAGTLNVNGAEIPFICDVGSTLQRYEEYARSMAPIRLKQTGTKQGSIPSSVSMFGGMGINSISDVNIAKNWASAHPEKSLAVPLGIDSVGGLFMFDIHESAHGPHGLVAGGTGSGKSQMAQTWIASMAMHFSPQDVNFILVDFKGESLLQPFEKLPHVAGTISNLDTDVARNFVALESELSRRQRLLKQYRCKDIIDYLTMKKQDRSMPDMPYLILVIDEYAEFKTQFPDFTKPVEHLYTGGRSLGVFTILMTQQPSGVVTDQMSANANFKWCLSVKSEADSRTLINTVDAAYIKNPGRAYVKIGSDPSELVQSLYCGAEYAPRNRSDSTPVISIVELNGTRVAATKKKSAASSGASQLETLVLHIAEYCAEAGVPAARPIWQKTLPVKQDLAELMAAGTKPSDSTAFIGCVDDPCNQRQDVIQHTFRDKGNLAVYGMPISGKTNFLRTLLLSVCMNYTPAQAQFYVVECGGFLLRNMDAFPHVGASTGDDEPETVKKIFALLTQKLELRKRAFKRHGVGSPVDYTEVSGETLADIILLVDNLNLLCQSMTDISTQLIKLASQGPSYGIFLACSFAGTMGASYQLTQNISNVYALQLADRSDYVSLVGRPVGNLPDGIRGRGFVRAVGSPLLFQTAIFGSELSDGKRTMEMCRLAERLSSGWRGSVPEAVRSMPEEIPFGSVEGEPIVLGLDTVDICPVRVDMKQAISLMVSAGTEDAERSFVASAVKQLAAVGEVILCAQNSALYNIRGADNVRLLSPSELPAAVEQLADVLRSRQQKLKADASATFEPVTVIIADFNAVLGAMPEDTAARLEVFIRLGKGLDFGIVAVDTVQNMTRAAYSAGILPVTLKQGAKLVIGGNVAEHQIADTYKLSAAHPQPLKQDEACLCVNGHDVFLKMMSED